VKALARPMALLRGLLARPLASYHLLLASAGLLLVIGLTMVFSATNVHAYATDGNAFTAIAEQATYAVFGLVAFWVCQRLPVRTLRALAVPLLLVAFALQAAVAGIAVLHSSGQLQQPRLGPVEAELGRWLSIGGVSLQPSELAKLALVVWAADVLARKGASLGWWREVARPLFPVGGLLLVLVGYQDLGTALVLTVLLVGMLWAAGVRLRTFAALGAAALAGVGLLVLVQGYRLPRLTAYLNPNCDVLEECYQARQGQTALADGGWFGVGLGSASHKWGWLPEGHNDFIFAVIGEELGVVGCLVVLALFAVLTYTGLRIARRVPDQFRRLAAAGVITWLLGQTVINIGGVVGLLPITGLPLPFISAGGSALVMTLAAVGMLASFARAEPDAARALNARPPARWVQLVWAPLPPMPPEPTRPKKRVPRARQPEASGTHKQD
jgi:cell division protein FtsW